MVMRAHVVEIIDKISVEETFEEEWNYVYGKDKRDNRILTLENGLNTDQEIFSCQRQKSRGNACESSPQCECNAPVCGTSTENLKYKHNLLANSRRNYDHCSRVDVEQLDDEQINITKQCREVKDMGITNQHTLLNSMLNKITSNRIKVNGMREHNNIYIERDNAFWDIVEGLLAIGTCMDKKKDKKEAFFSTKENTEHCFHMRKFTRNNSSFKCIVNKKVEKDCCTTLNSLPLDDKKKGLLHHSFSPICRRKYVTLTPCFRNCFDSRYKSVNDCMLTSHKNINGISLTNTANLTQENYKNRTSCNCYDMLKREENMNDLIRRLPSNKNLKSDEKHPKQFRDFYHPTFSEENVTEMETSQAWYAKKCKSITQYPNFFPRWRNRKQLIIKPIKKTREKDIQMISSGAVPTEANIYDYLSFHPFKLKI